MPSEKSITNSIIKKLNAMPKCKAIKMHGSIYSRRGTPDIMGVWKGNPFFLEVKRVGQKATALQNKEIGEWNEVGATAVVVRSADEAMEIIKERF